MEKFCILAATFLLISWDVIQQYILHVDGAGRLPFWASVLLLFFLMLFDKKIKKIQFSSPMIWIWLFCIYSVLNVVRIGISHTLVESDEIFYYNAISPFILFAFIFLAQKTNPEKYLKIIFFSMYLSCLLYFLNTRQNTWGGENYSAARLSSETVNSNFLAFYATASFFVLLVCNNKHKMNKLLLFACGILSGIIVLLTASRTGYICYVLLLCSKFISKIKISFTKIFGIIVILLLLFGVNKWIMANTEIGYRFSMRNYESENAAYRTETILDNIFGERIVYFMALSKLFPEYPLCGVGEKNFIDHNPFGEQLVCHNEYIRQLTEGGLIGFSLFALVFIVLWKKLFSNLRQYPERRSTIILSMSGVLCIMLAYFGSYMMPMMQIILAVAAAENFNNTAHEASAEKKLQTGSEYQV